MNLRTGIRALQLRVQIRLRFDDLGSYTHYVPVVGPDREGDHYTIHVLLLQVSSSWLGVAVTRMLQCCHACPR